MSCFSFALLEQWLIWLVWIIVAVAIIKLLVPAVLGWVGSPPGGAAVMTALGYIVWGVIAVFIIVVVFDLLACAFGGSGFGLRGLR